jgi:HK97 family phage portal protein
MAVVVSDGQLARIDPAWNQPNFGMGALSLYGGPVQDYETLYKTQPNLRLVIDFLARNTAQLGLKVYRRLSDTDREHVGNHGLANLMVRPNSWTTRYELFDSLVHDLCVYGNAFWLKVKNRGSLLELWRLPPGQVSPKGRFRMRSDAYVWRGPTGVEKEFAASELVHFKNWNPFDQRVGLSPLESLRRILAEDAASGEYRENFWRNRARPEVVVKYPGVLSDGAIERLRTQWDQRYTGPERSGNTAFLEEGADVTTLSQSFHDSQYLEVRRLTREEVAAAYHVPPTMVGLMEKTSYSNMATGHKILYADTLGPLLKQIEETIVLQLLPEFSDRDRVYVEFNIQEKLAGALEEAATQLQTSVGAAFMSRNEARARLNLPSIEGGDGLVTPLNVLVGGQASPTDSAPPPKHLPAYVPDELDESATNGSH